MQYFILKIQTSLFSKYRLQTLNLGFKNVFWTNKFITLNNKNYMEEIWFNFINIDFKHGIQALNIKFGQ